MLYLKLAWRNIWRNKRRTLITASSIMFAVFFAILLSSVQDGVYEGMIDNATTFYLGHAQVHKEGYWAEKTLDNSFEYTPEIQQTVNGIPVVKTAVPRIESGALAAYGNRTKAALVIGIDPQKEKQLMRLEDKIQSGSYFDAIDEKSILVAEELASYLQIGLGDTIVLLSQGFRGANAVGKYPIKGILKFPSPNLNKTAAFLPLKEAQWFYAAENRLTSLAVLANSTKEVNAAVQAFSTQLDSKQYEVMGWRTLIPEIIQQIELKKSSSNALLFILYLIIGFGIFGTILMMTAERRKEFGVLLSIGMKRGRLMFLTWLEIIFLGLLGVTMGCLVSFPLIWYLHTNPIPVTGDFAEAYEKFGIEPIIPTALDPAIFMNQAVWVCFIVSLLALYPIGYLWRIRPIDAMRA
ncbi:MAG: ABC transporter permease [Chitinophagales bacterium]